MRLYEHEAKEIIRKAKIPVPEGKVVETAREAKGAAEPWAGQVVLKAQVLTGGRGKAGGILFASSEQQAEDQAQELLAKKIKGFEVNRILVEPALSITKEYYLGLTIDRINYNVVLIGSSEGGIEIEEIARLQPEKIFRLHRQMDEPLYAFQGIELAKKMGLAGKKVTQVSSIARALLKIFHKYDAKLVEINPLAELEDGSLMAIDARMSIDEDALFRQPELAQMGVEDRHEEGEMTPREKQARDEGIPYLDLEGNIGMFPGGAGFGIYAIDMIRDMGGEPANFMDSGGGPTPERIAQMLMLLQENPQVKVIFGARFGGVSRCDDFARGVIIFLKTGKLTKPIVMRMTGNMWREGLEIFDQEKKKNAQLFEKVEIHGIETPIEEIARRTVELAQKAR